MKLPVPVKASLFDEKCHIDGEWISSDNKKTLDVHNPSTNESIGTIPNMGREEVLRAVTSAQQAAPVWAAKTHLQRADMLMAWHAKILENKKDLAAILTSENGKPLKEAEGEIAYSASFVRWFAEEGRRTYGRHIPEQKPGTRVIVINQPIGVSAAITPWNFPAAMVTRKLAPALAAGCPMIIKPSEFTPYTAIALVKLAEEVGFSKANGLAGVIQLVTGDAAAIGQVFCEHPVVKKISLTGSTRVGKILMKQSAEGIKKLSLELGGNAPFIVFEDADLDAAVTGAALCKYRNGGQTCVCANRLFVQDSIYDAFVDKLSAHVSQFKVADGFSNNVEIGPLINQPALEKVSAHVADAVSKGAKVLTGGKPHSLGGNFYEPTVLRDVSPDALVHREETFGPLGAVIPFSDEAQVVEQANSTEFGLSAYFYSQNISRVWRVAEKLEAGMVGVNDGIISAENTPFGGVKQSGIGREGGIEGIQEYMQSKYILMGGIQS